MGFLADWRCREFVIFAARQHIRVLHFRFPKGYLNSLSDMGGTFTGYNDHRKYVFVTKTKPFDMEDGNHREWFARNIAALVRKVTSSR